MFSTSRGVVALPARRARLCRGADMVRLVPTWHHETVRPSPACDHKRRPFCLPSRVVLQAIFLADMCLHYFGPTPCKCSIFWLHIFMFMDGTQGYFSLLATYSGTNIRERNSSGLCTATLSSVQWVIEISVLQPRCISLRSSSLAQLRFLLTLR